MLLRFPMPNFLVHIYVNKKTLKMKKLIEFHLKLEILSVSFMMSALIKIIIE